MVRLFYVLKAQSLVNCECEITVLGFRDLQFVSLEYLSRLGEWHGGSDS